jgi:hypothetical protein
MHSYKGEAMVDFIGTVITAFLMVLVVNALTIFMEIPRSTKLLLAGGIGLWIGLCAAASAAGTVAITQPFPIIGLFVGLPLAAGAIAWAVPAGRAALLSIPMPVMIGLNVGRVAGALFLVLEAQGRLAGPFPFFAAWGDIITGLLALPIMRLAATTGVRHWTPIAAWNLFGTADLVNAIALGVMSAEGSPLQIFHAAPGSAAVQQLPWSFVPTVLVPFYLILHGVIWAQLLRQGKPAYSP